MMSSPEQIQGAPFPEADPIEVFYAYGLEAKRKLNDADWALREGLRLASNLELLNEALEAAGRPDLTIKERAEMMRVISPGHILEKGDNFNRGFKMFTGITRVRQGPFNRLVVARTPPTTEEVLQLRDFPVVEDLQSYIQQHDSGKYAFVLEGVQPHHEAKASFLRMLNLFPEFTADLIVDISAATATDRDSNAFRPFDGRLFVAYQVMSHSVDVSDRGVHDMGKLNNQMLFA
jgi:hypothetical protein